MALAVDTLSRAAHLILLSREYLLLRHHSVDRKPQLGESHSIARIPLRETRAARRVHLPHHHDDKTF
eukprot:SAG11_NODE_253_length_11591_cov_15.933693_8_plen_67_part_00